MRISDWSSDVCSSDLPLEAILLDRAEASLDELLLGEGEPADIGIIGFEPRAGGAAEQLPQRQARFLGTQIPQGDVERGEREMRDPGARDTSESGIARELEPHTAIGRESCAGRVCQYVSISVGAGRLSKQTKKRPQQ